MFRESRTIGVNRGTRWRALQVCHAEVGKILDGVANPDLHRVIWNALLWSLLTSRTGRTAGCPYEDRQHDDCKYWHFQSPPDLSVGGDPVFQALVGTYHFHHHTYPLVEFLLRGCGALSPAMSKDWLILEGGVSKFSPDPFIMLIPHPEELRGGLGQVDCEYTLGHLLVSGWCRLLCPVFACALHL